jgi:hypothetical protein
MAAAAVDSEVQAVLNNAEMFEKLVEQLLSGDNAPRKAAEVVYDKVKAHPDACVFHLLRTLRQCEHLEKRAFCAIMLRKVSDLGPCIGTESSIHAGNDKPLFAGSDAKRA